ncbi:MAG: 6,7-dimethyl-8-ribityllumazine synthase [Akkermansiaceae bacterium]|nr:6,7-dimethyl-8-ribityllumazine synthase [Akkermansiaceae bacterium]
MSIMLQPKPRIIGHKVRICIVASKYNEKFTDSLVENCIEELGEIIPMSRIDLIRVPGAFEIPVAVAAVMDREEINCIIALGLIISGDTGHADLVAASVTESLQSLAVKHIIPVIHEVLLVEDEKQAYARCIATAKNRGREAARAAASIIDVFAEIEKSIPKGGKRKTK